MQPAADRLAEVLAPIEIKDITTPVVANVTAQKLPAVKKSKNSWLNKGAMPVLWGNLRT